VEAEKETVESRAASSKRHRKNGNKARKKKGGKPTAPTQGKRK